MYTVILVTSLGVGNTVPILQIKLSGFGQVSDLSEPVYEMRSMGLTPGVLVPMKCTQSSSPAPGNAQH